MRSLAKHGVQVGRLTRRILSRRR